ncbi:hypothetical protein CR513_07758, partial [Mucuna pruriens]
MTKKDKDYLKSSKYRGCEKTKGIQVLNLGREFDIYAKHYGDRNQQRYDNRPLSITNKYKKFLTLPKRYESKILALEDSKYLSNITFEELINAL